MDLTREKKDFRPNEEPRQTALDLEAVRREEAIRLRDEFLQIASHELKTPIASLQLQLQLIKRQLRRVSDQEIKVDTFIHEVDASLRQVAVLTHLINDLLDVSKIQTGQLALHPEPLELAPLVTDILDRYSEMLKGAGCELEATLTPSISVQADPARIEQVAVSLISNVCKYAPGSKLTVELKADAQRAFLIFKDDGPGIAGEHLASILERFARGTAGVNVSGFGLGLYITKGIIEAHGGQIALAENTEDRRGLAATIDLPRINV